MTGSYVGYSFAVPSNIAEKSLKTLWSTATCNEIIGVEGGELNATLRLGINKPRVLCWCSDKKFRC
jgi:hypothetical protein